MKWVHSVCVFAALVAGLAPPNAFGQAVSGAITGYVYDTSDAVIAKAVVTVTSTTTGTRASRVTDSDGRFIITNLDPGTYTVSVEAVDFRRFVQENVILRVDSTVRIDPRLELGAVTEQLTVSAGPPVLTTEKTDVRQYIPEQQLQELPTFGRNLSKLYNTIPRGYSKLMRRSPKDSWVSFAREASIVVLGSFAGTDGAPHAASAFSPASFRTSLRFATIV